jgi:hypothetical protein
MVFVIVEVFECCSFAFVHSVFVTASFTPCKYCVVDSLMSISIAVVTLCDLSLWKEAFDYYVVNILDTSNARYALRASHLRATQWNQMTRALIGLMLTEALNFEMTVDVLIS